MNLSKTRIYSISTLQILVKMHYNKTKTKENKNKNKKLYISKGKTKQSRKLTKYLEINTSSCARSLFYDHVSFLNSCYLNSFLIFMNLSALKAEISIFYPSCNFIHTSISWVLFSFCPITKMDKQKMYMSLGF